MSEDIIYHPLQRGTNFPEIRDIMISDLVGKKKKSSKSILKVRCSIERVVLWIIFQQKKSRMPMNFRMDGHGGRIPVGSVVQEENVIRDACF